MTAPDPAEEAFSPALVPLVIGVTGHRDLRPQDVTALRSEVREFFLTLKATYPNTPLIVLSALAEGADRLVAKVGLECSVGLIAPLPMAQPIYERDFSTDESLAEFRELLSRAQGCIEMPVTAGVQLSHIEQDGQDRNAQYALVGGFIARHCQILLALWDGNQKESEGGTSQVVRLQNTGVPAAYGGSSSPLDAAESGPVYHIVTPRSSRYTVPSELVPLTRRELLPRTGVPSDHEMTDLETSGTHGSMSADRLAREAFDRVFTRLDGFNKDAIRLATSARLLASRTALLAGVPTDDLDAGAQRNVDAYLTADALAIYFQRWTSRTLRALLLLGLIAVGSFSFFAHLGFNRLWLVVYLVTLLAAYALFAWSAPFAAPFVASTTWLARPFRRLWTRRGDWQSRYLDYRALAEGMRVQLFWSLAGIPDCAADHYLRKQRTELDWIRHAIRSWTLMGALATTKSPSSPNTSARLDLALNHWIEDQRSFFTNAAERDQKSVRNKEVLVLSLFSLALVLTGALLIFDLGANEALYGSREITIVAVVLLIGASALVEFWAEKTAIAEHVKQYVRMRGLFTRASEALRNPDLSYDPQSVIRELGEEALSENADWLLLHRSRPVSVARGG